jgi:hypothetical protein
MSSANKKSNCLPYFNHFYFSSLIVLTKNSCTIFIKSRESGHPCFIRDFGGNVFPYLIQCWLYMTYIYIYMCHIYVVI